MICRHPVAFALIACLAFASHSFANLLDAETGRWLHRDAGEQMTDPNLYDYVDGRPLTQVDPAGLTPVNPQGERRSSCNFGCGGGPSPIYHGCISDTNPWIGFICLIQCVNDPNMLGTTLCVSRGAPGICCICDSRIRKLFPNQDAQRIISGCIGAHETVHQSQADLCRWNELDIQYHCNECWAYQAELLCLTGHRGDCEQAIDPTACLADVDARIGQVNRWIASECAACAQ